MLETDSCSRTRSTFWNKEGGEERHFFSGRPRRRRSAADTDADVVTSSFGVAPAKARRLRSVVSLADRWIRSVHPWLRRAQSWLSPSCCRCCECDGLWDFLCDAKRPPSFFRLGTNNKNKGVCSNYSVKLRGPNTSACRRITSRDCRKICAQVIQPLEECLKTSFWTFLRKVLSTVSWLFYHPPLPDHPLRSSSRIPKRGRSRKRKSEQLSD